ncbi:MAG: hypothetical protein J6386_23475 [Candidatus Synoicihabitans palmerolidicus]|nr:hypothetical protein [Candidatus Synoicihabitans palmerolidicus]
MDRSARCVIVGFLVASFIAIPLGILCGLNRIFMAAITPPDLPLQAGLSHRLAAHHLYHCRRLHSRSFRFVQ